MATWQFHFKIVPYRKLNDKYNSIPSTIDFTIESEDSFSWKDYDINEDSIKYISQFLEPMESWSEDIKQFGSIEKSCLEFIYESSQLLEISVRLDLRTLTKDVLISILKFIENNEAYIILDNGKVLPPSFEIMFNEIKISDAYTFVNDPKKFISQLGE